MKTLNLGKRKTETYGVYAAYFRLSRFQGVKVYKRGYDSDAEAIKFKKDIDFTEVKKDFDFIKSIQCSIVPKVYRIVAVKIDGGWYPGVIMEHVSGMHIHEFIKGDKRQWSILQDVQEEFTKTTGYIHEDLHRYNVIFQKEKKTYKVIDLTVDYVTPTKRAA